MVEKMAALKALLLAELTGPQMVEYLDNFLVVVTVAKMGHHMVGGMVYQ